MVDCVFEHEIMIEAFSLREAGLKLSEISLKLNIKETNLSERMKSFDKKRYERLGRVNRPVLLEQESSIKQLVLSGVPVSEIHALTKASKHAIGAFIKLHFSLDEIDEYKKKIWNRRESFKTQEQKEKFKKEQKLRFSDPVLRDKCKKGALEAAEKNRKYTPEVIRTHLDSLGVPWLAGVLKSDAKVSFFWPCGSKREMFIARAMLKSDLGEPRKSRSESELCNWVSGLWPSAHRAKIGKREIDVFIPELSLGIDIGGEYWHSDSKVSKHYHKEKLEFFKSKNIHLIQIFEHEWNSEKERIKNFLISRFNKSGQGPALDIPGIEIIDPRTIVIDLRFVSADDYTKSGLVVEEILPPDYFYFNKYKGKVGKSAMVSRVKEDTMVSRVRFQSESDYALREKFLRIWDCGKIRLKLPVKTV